eukprot:Em0002g688a
MSVMLVSELVKIGPTVQGPMKSWAMAATTRAQAKKRREDTRTEHKEAEWGKRQACGGTVGIVRLHLITECNPRVEEPFGRIVMDIVEALPRSWSGHKYILVVCNYVTRRGCQMLELVKDNLAPAQVKQKQWYDKNARHQEFKEFKDGDQVTPVTYEVNMHDKRKKKIFHVNMLKEWNMPTTVCLWTEEMNEEGMMLKGNTTLKVLVLRECGLQPEGLEEVMKGVEVNTKLETLVLWRNIIDNKRASCLDRSLLLFNAWYLEDGALARSSPALNHVHFRASSQHSFTNQPIDMRTGDHGNADVLSRLPVGPDISFDQDEDVADVDTVCTIKTVSLQQDPTDPGTMAKESAKDPVIANSHHSLHPEAPEEFQSWCRERGITYLTGAPMISSCHQRGSRTSSADLQTGSFEVLTTSTSSPSGVPDAILPNTTGRQIRTKIDVVLPSPVHIARESRPKQLLNLRNAREGSQMGAGCSHEKLRPRYVDQEDTDPGPVQIQTMEPVVSLQEATLLADGAPTPAMAQMPVLVLPPVRKAQNPCLPTGNKYSTHNPRRSSRRPISRKPEHNTTLSELWLEECGLRDEAICELCGGLKWCKLKLLDLTDNPFGDQGAKGLADVLKDHPTLEELWMWRCKEMSDDGVQHLMDATMSNTRVKKLVLSSKYNGLTVPKELVGRIQFI